MCEVIHNYERCVGCYERCMRCYERCVGYYRSCALRVSSGVCRLLMPIRYVISHIQLMKHVQVTMSKFIILSF